MSTLLSGYRASFRYQGDVLVAGKVYFYENATTTLKTIYTDAGGGTPAANPATTDANGEILVYLGLGPYTVSVYTAVIPTGALVSSTDNVEATGRSSLYPLTDPEDTLGLDNDDIDGTYPTFNVLRYGATGDGSTNDTTAIQRAIDVAYTAGGGTVFFPQSSASYRCNLILKKWVILHGDSSGGTTLKAFTSSPVIENFQSESVVRAQIRDLKLDGNGNTSDCIYFHYNYGSTFFVDECSIDNVRLENFKKGLRLVGHSPYPSDASFIQNLKAYGLRAICAAGSEEGIYIEGVILETHFYSCAVATKPTGFSMVRIRESTTVPTEYAVVALGTERKANNPGRVSFHGCYFAATGTSGVIFDIDNARALAWRSCYFENCARALDIAGVGASGTNGGSGPGSAETYEFAGSQDFVLDGCQFRNQASAPILLTACSGFTASASRFIRADGDVHTTAIDASAATPANVNGVDIGYSNSVENGYTILYDSAGPLTVATGATISVAGSREWFVNNADDTEITAITGATEGVPFTLLAAAPTTPQYLLAGATFRISGHWYATSGDDSITLVLRGTVFYEVGRGRRPASKTVTSGTTQDVSGYDTLIATMGGAVSVTDFVGRASEHEGKRLCVLATNGNLTVVDGAPIQNTASANKTFVAGESATYVSIGGVWYQQSGT